ncbi:MAG: sigma 54-interacting transcriptional regulator [Deltaproteobacteria bacterium]|nr:sigma 54-interacting transcriptional regulator [Deltaproteobacteria bacterium]
MSNGRSLLVLQGSDARLVGRVVPLGDALRIGRRADADLEVVIDDKLLSGRHATITRDAAGYELVDHRSKNGSFVDGERVERVRLRDGSVIRLGVHVFQVVGEADVFGWQDGSVAGDETHALVGRSAHLGRLVQAIDSRAPGSAPLLLVGEHGTGKEACARRLHARSGRRGEFVSLACGSTTPLTAAHLLFGGDGDDAAAALALGVGGTGIVPRDVGLVVLAHEGTLFLDGVDSLDRATQLRLARLVREGRLSLPGGDAATLDVRLVVSSELDLEPVVEDGQLAPEVFEVLAAETVELPSLRSRRCDIGDIATHAWARLTGGRSLAVTATAHEKLLLHDWPSNVRELVGLLGRVLATVGPVDVLRSAHLPSKIRERVDQHTVDQLRASAVDIQLVPARDELAKLLVRFNGDVASIAHFFARDKRQVYRWLKRHDLKLSQFRVPGSPLP